MPNFKDDAARLAWGLLRLSNVLASEERAAALVSGIPALQLQILDALALHDGPMNVSSLAGRFAITAATVSDSVKVMESKGLVTKSRQPRDARVVNIGLTDRGRAIVETSRIWQERLKTIIGNWGNQRQGEVLQAILSIIAGMQRETDPPVDRICVTCQHFAINCDVNASSVPFYCRTLARAISETQLQIDCELYAPLASQSTQP